MYAHIYAVLLAHRHNGGKEIPHVLAERIAVDTFVQSQQIPEYIHRILVAFLDVAVYESLRLYDNRIDKAVFFGFGDGLVQFGHFSQLFGGVILFGSLTLQNAQVEIGKAHPVEVER